MRVLFYNTGERIPVWGVSHAGHVSVPRPASGFSEIRKNSTEPFNRYPISRSSQCSTTGVTKAVVCAILSVGWCI